MHKTLRSCLLYPLLGSALLNAADGDAPPTTPSPWEWHTKLGVFFNNTSAHNSETSHDPAIASTTDSAAYKLSGMGILIWKEDKDRIEQKLEGDYGRIRTQGQDSWQENVDRLAYGLLYERTLTKPNYIYGNATAESVFTGKEPEKNTFDPAIAKLSTGFGQRYENLLPEKDSLIWRAGVYMRKRWESNVPDYQTRVESGPEAFARYERKQSDDVSYFLQYQAFGVFDDASHVTNIADAGLSVKVAKLITVEFKARAYYETRPKEAADTDPGYNQWSMREEAVIGLVWETGSN